LLWYKPQDERVLRSGAGTAAGRLYAPLGCRGQPRARPGSLEAFASQRDTWEHLPRDASLRDGGAYRARRHSCSVQAVGATPDGRAAPAATADNALHGGLTRWFEPIEPAVRTNPAWLRLLASLGALFAAVHPVPPRFIEAHQFRIDTGSGIGRPTPEGAHRDGVDFVAVIPRGPPSGDLRADAGV
jgi:hypothetical protein